MRMRAHDARESPMTGWRGGAPCPHPPQERRESGPLPYIGPLGNPAPGGGGNLSARGGKRFLVRCTACGRARWENRKNGQVEIYGWHWPTFPAGEGRKT